MTPEQTAALQALNSEPPSIREELERKTVEEIERAFLAVRQGKMTSYGYHQALQGLWGGVAGLVSKESMELISAAQKEYPAGLGESMRSVTVIGEIVAVVRWPVGGIVVETSLKKPGTPLAVKEIQVEDGSPATALRLYLTTTKKFRDMAGAQPL
ncbi:hypothetical protein AB6809_29705 [Paraburkholderia sp. RCC_158]|uniref:hypothetical protein n=1 Tax=Paraburkholderia sp. RCC_158 TaxID=3239220 RepID=UPI0035247BF5